jgi:DNA-binding MarR family transcriptional regulator
VLLFVAEHAVPLLSFEFEQVARYTLFELESTGGRMPDELSDAELGAYFALRRTADRLEQVVTRHLKAHDLSEIQFSVLATLHDSSEGVRMTDLADRLVVSKSGLTYQVAQLEARGLVARAGASGDDRSVVARLTVAGAALIEIVLPEHVGIVRESFIAALEPGEVQVLGDALGRTAARLAQTKPGRIRPRAD